MAPMDVIPGAVGPQEETGARANGDVSNDDATLIQQAEEFYDVQQLLSAAQRLRLVKDKSLLQAEHLAMLSWAGLIEEGMNDLLIPPDAEGSSWKKQSERHGHRDFLVYYQVCDQRRLHCRIDSVIEGSLLVPLLSVFNESDLYHTWMPSYQWPIKFGVGESEKLKEPAIGNQIIRVTVNLAWPFRTREMVQHVIAVDVIDDQGVVAIHSKTETHEDDPDIPEPRENVVRIDLSGTVVFQGCPEDHSLLAKSKHAYPEGEPKILIGLKTSLDANIAGIPISIINFVTRTIFASMWSSVLQVAEDVREGKRPMHKEVISSNRELYDFVDERVARMLVLVHEESQQDAD